MTRRFPFVGIILAGVLAGCGASKGGGDEGETCPAGSTLTLPQTQLTVTAGGPAVSIGANLSGCTAMVQWTLAGPGGLDRTSGVPVAYTPPATIPGSTPVTATLTASAGGLPPVAMTITIEPPSPVCPPGTPLLTGQYAFLVQGFSRTSHDGVAMIGSLTFDGCGLVTAGSVDYHLGATVGGNASLTGSYTVGTDHRGTLTLTMGPATATFAIAVGRISAGVATKAALAEMDAAAAPGTVLSGVMFRQTPAAFSLAGVAGPFAFVLNGWNGAGPRSAMGGTLSADAAGHLDGGALDSMTFGSSAPVTTASWTGSWTVPGANGRMVVTAPDLTGATGSAVAYVVAATHVLALVRDASSGGRVLSGRLLGQVPPFGLSSLSGKSVAWQVANYTQPQYEGLTWAILTLITADGAGKLTLDAYDHNSGGNFSSGGGIEYSYAVDAHGQATVFVGGGVPGGKWYVLGPNTGLMLGFDQGVSAGQILARAAGPFSAASISGEYLVSQAPGGSWGSRNASGVATSAGTGTMATTIDVNDGGTTSWGHAETGTLTVGADGRATDGNGNIIYVVAPSRLLRMNLGTFCPVIDVFDQ